MSNDTIVRIGSALIVASCVGMGLVLGWILGAKPSSVLFRRRGDRVFKRALLVLALGFLGGSVVLLFGPFLTRAQ